MAELSDAGEPANEPAGAEPGPVARVLVDQAGIVVAADRGAAALFGYGGDALVGLPCDTLLPDRLPPDPRPEAAPAARQTFALRQDGTRTPIHLILDPVESAAGPAILASAWPIGGQVRLSVPRTAPVVSAEADRVLADFSHEVRTPLSGILGVVALMMEHGLEPVQQQRAETIRGAAEALLGIVDNVLDLSKIEAGKVEIEKIDFDLVETVEDVIELMSGRARERRIDLAVFVEPGLHTMVRGDPTRLRQILLNLVGNAIKFTEKGAVSVEITALGSDEQGLQIRFDVIDTGIGIAESAVPTLFEKYTQADSTVTRRFGGTGLGLAISRELVERMGGTIGVESVLGQGSRFWFTLRLGESAAEAAAGLPAVAALQGRRGLIVNAVTSTAGITARQLEALGLSVTCVADGFDAAAELERRAFHKAPYDLVVIDRLVTGLSAEALTRRLRDNPDFTGLRIVVTAGPTDPIDPTAPIDLVLIRPVRHRSLAEGLARLFVAPPGPAEISSPESGSSRAGEEPRTGRRILVAEDNDVNRLIAVSYLTRAGYSVDAATDGQQAIDAVKREAYDLILMDAHMPILDGTEATRRIRRMAPPRSTIPVIALTASTLAGAREKYLAVGMNDYLSKPFKREELLDVVARWLPGGDRSAEGGP